MIRYRRLYESEDSDIDLYDIVSCAGYEWYVLKIEDDIVTLLAKNDDFGIEIFDEESNDYATSHIRDYLLSEVLPEVQSANPIPTRLDDVGVTDKVWLLSLEEKGNKPWGIFEYTQVWWWLRTPSKRKPNRVVCVNHRGASSGTNGFEPYYGSIGVRPAMRVHIKDLD